MSPRQRRAPRANPRRGAVLAAALSLALAAWAWAQPLAVPVSLGQGTGGDGAWEAGAAEHSPTTVRVEVEAGPEGTPAAVVEFTFAADKYNWQWIRVGIGSACPAAAKAVRFTYRTDVPQDFPSLNVMVRESTAAMYWVHAVLPLSPRRFATVTVPLDRFSLCPWSKDANGALDASLIDQVGFGFESGSSGTGMIFMSDVQLVPEGW